MIMRKLCTGIFQICCYYQVYFIILEGKYLEKKDFIPAYSTYRKMIEVKQIISPIHPPKCPPLRGGLGRGRMTLPYDALCELPYAVHS